MKIIMAHLEKENGFSPVHDKSDPEKIKSQFGMSKKLLRRPLAICISNVPFELKKMASISAKSKPALYNHSIHRQHNAFNQVQEKYDRQQT